MMRYVLIFCVIFLMSCKNTTTKDNVIESKKINKVQKEGKVEESHVKVDADGVAIILIKTNDVMKYDVKKFEIREGQKVKLTLIHTGKLDKKVMGHNVVILKEGVKLSAFASKAAAARDNDYIPNDSKNVIAHTKMIGGGESTTVEFIAPKAGVYDFICSFPAHFAMMKGKMIVN